MERLIDFRELEARGEPGEQFEHLMRALFEAKGMRVNYSGRGPDGGLDLLVEEPIQGVITGEGIEVRRWLVWCRNHARAERSVRDDEIPDVLNKCGQHHVDGFVAATTTVLSVGAKNTLDGLTTNPRNQYLIRQLNQYDIEKWVINNEDVFRQFLPLSYRRYQALSAGPSISERQLQRLIEDTHNRQLEPPEVRRLLAEFLTAGISDFEELRSIYTDPDIHNLLNEIYQRLLGRGVDPFGHFTWGRVVQQWGSVLGGQIVEDQIRRSPEFASRANVVVTIDFHRCPDFTARFKKPCDFADWSIYRSENSRGCIEKMSDDRDTFVRLKSDSPDGFRTMYPAGRVLGFHKPICIPQVRYSGVLQVFFALQVGDGDEYWLVYQTGETSTSKEDRLDPRYHVMMMILEPGDTWRRPELRLEHDFEQRFGMTYRAVKNVSFHVEGQLDIHSLEFITVPND